MGWMRLSTVLLMEKPNHHQSKMLSPVVSYPSESTNIRWIGSLFFEKEAFNHLKRRDELQERASECKTVKTWKVKCHSENF